MAQSVLDAVDMEAPRCECFMVELESSRPVGDERLLGEVQDLLARQGGSSADVVLGPEGTLRASFQLRAESSWQALQVGVVIMGHVLGDVRMERDYRHLRSSPNPGACACG